MKFALLSVTYSGLFYSGKALSLEEQIYKARELGFDGLSIESKRPIASPLDLTKSERLRIKAVAEDQGITLCAIESLSNFSSRLMENRENNLAMMRLVLQLAADLGIDIVKVFAAWPGIINDEEDVALYGPEKQKVGKYYERSYPAELRKWNHAVEGIKETADIAADMGITLALQNHGPVISPGYEDVFSMLQEIDRKNVKLCLDVPLFYKRQEDEYIKEAVDKCGKNIILTHLGAWNFSRNNEGEVIQEPAPSFGGQINYESYIQELEKIDYDGFMVTEYCLPVLKKHKIAGVEEIDEAIKNALEYIKGIANKSNI